MKAIANTTVVSNFAAVGRLDLLPRLLGEVFISTEVYGEVLDGLGAGYSFYEEALRQVRPLAEGGWLYLTALDGTEELRLFASLPEGLHRGESSCLAIARCRGWAFLSDDAHARSVARSLGIVVSGTLGVLVQSVRANLLSLAEADTLLAQMVRSGYYAPCMTLAELI